MVQYDSVSPAFQKDGLCVVFRKLCSLTCQGLVLMVAKPVPEILLPFVSLLGYLGIQLPLILGYFVSIPCHLRVHWPVILGYLTLQVGCPGRPAFGVSLARLLM